MAIDFESAKDGELTVRLNGAPRKTFKFDAVFGHQATQGNYKPIVKVKGFLFFTFIVYELIKRTRN